MRFQIFEILMLLVLIIILCLLNEDAASVSHKSSGAKKGTNCIFLHSELHDSSSNMMQYATEIWLINMLSITSVCPMPRKLNRIFLWTLLLSVLIQPGDALTVVLLHGSYVPFCLVTQSLRKPLISTLSSFHSAFPRCLGVTWNGYLNSYISYSELLEIFWQLAWKIFDTCCPSM